MANRYQQNPASRIKAYSQIMEYISIPDKMRPEHEETFLYWANQLAHQTPTIREIKCTTIIDCAYGIYFIGYYEYGLKVVRLPFIVFFDGEGKTFHMFIKAGHKFEQIKPQLLSPKKDGYKFGKGGK